MFLRSAAILVVLVLAACASVPASTPPSVGPTASEQSSRAPSPSASAEPSATPSPSGVEAADVRPGTIARALLPGIALRVEAGLKEDRAGILPEGSRSYVVSGPVEADGYQWIQLAGLGLPEGTGCLAPTGGVFSCPGWFGWAAMGDPETGDAWFVDDPTKSCPDPGLETRDFMLLTEVEALHCYGSRQIQFTGWLTRFRPLRDLGECIGKDAAAKWLWCSEEYALRVWASDSEDASIDVFVDPKARRQLADPGHWPIVVGHFDDPTASECDAATPDGWPVDPEAVTFQCRANFVLTMLGGVGP